MGASLRGWGHCALLSLEADPAGPAEPGICTLPKSIGHQFLLSHHQSSLAPSYHYYFSLSQPCRELSFSFPRIVETGKELILDCAVEVGGEKVAL
jgi:hypothetical protein